MLGDTDDSKRYRENSQYRMFTIPKVHDTGTGSAPNPAGGAYDAVSVMMVSCFPRDFLVPRYKKISNTFIDKKCAKLYNRHVCSRCV